VANGEIAMSSLFSVAEVRRMDTLRQGCTGDAALTKTTRDKASLQLKQSHQRDISPRCILHDSVGMRDDLPSTLRPRVAFARRLEGNQFVWPGYDLRKIPRARQIRLRTSAAALIPKRVEQGPCVAQTAWVAGDNPIG
jgi:hypothetical protein